MPISRYPRRNHRIAPATLRELLGDPVPLKYLKGRGSQTPLRLCDLDENAWQQFSEATCCSLSRDVVRAVGRCARMPMSISDRHLPALPDGLRLTDLELEARTLNCLVAAGIHRRPQDLRAMTIEGVLSLRGFWVKCLLDLLTSLEYAIEHPGTPPAGAESEARVPRAASRYPRPGDRLAPQALREILADPLPPDIVRGTRYEGRRLADLDEAAWEVLGRDAVERLSERVVARVNISGYGRAVQQRCLPAIPKGLRLEDLRIENRTYNCLRRAGFGAHPENLAHATIGEILSIKAFGAKCLVDFLTALEAITARSGQLDERLSAEAEALAALPAAETIPFGDPRLGGLLRATDSEANTVAELARRILRRRLDPPDPMGLYQQICEIRRTLETLQGLSLEEELIQIFAPSPSPRDREIVAGYYGWDGQQGRTLESLGRRFGLSRERIRQVCVRALKRSQRMRVFAPVLDRALDFLRQRTPCPGARLQAELDAAGFSACRLPLRVIHEAARFLGREPPFTLVNLGQVALAVRPEAAALPRAIVQAARRATLSYGAATIAEIEAELGAQHAGIDGALVTQTLQVLPDFCWLDEGRGWFQLECLPQYGLPNMIEKVLAVAGRVDVNRLRSAILRYRRSERSAPPSKVLLEFCRRLKGVRVEGQSIVAEDRRDWRIVLGGVEASMVEVLLCHGPVMERGEFEDRCVQAGMNRFSFNAIIMSSPVIVQYGRSVYGLLGAKVDRKTIRSLSQRRAAIGPSRVLEGYGKTANGQVYLAYRLSKASISGGVITVPAALKQQVCGQFDIRTPEGATAGTLVSKNGCAWGLGPALRARRARPDDHLLVLFDPQQRQAVIHLGDLQSLGSLLGPAASSAAPHLRQAGEGSAH